MKTDPTKFRGRYRIASSRLKGWDYRTPGYYFITICTHKWIPYFGEIVDGEMHLSSLGEIAQKYWCDIPNHFTHVTLDEFVVMPNHVHGIVVINADDSISVETQHGVVELQHCAVETQHGAVELQHGAVETQHAASLQRDEAASLRRDEVASLRRDEAASLQRDEAASLRKQQPVRGSVPTIIRSYKSAVKHWAGLNDYGMFAWQERYYDHIIRDEKSLQNIRAYIRVNPLQWESDEYHT